MKIAVNSVHFDADADLINFVHERVNKLENHFDGIIGGEVFLRLDNVSNSKENKITEIKLLAPGKELFAKKQCKSFEEATDTAVDALRKQMTKHKEKLRATK